MAPNRRRDDLNPSPSKGVATKSLDWISRAIVGARKYDYTETYQDHLFRKVLVNGVFRGNLQNRWPRLVEGVKV